MTKHKPELHPETLEIARVAAVLAKMPERPWTNAVQQDRGTRAVVKYLNSVGYPFIVADHMPSLIRSDRTISRGPNKGRRVVQYTHRAWTESERDWIVCLLTGLGGVEDLHMLKQFAWNEKRQTMFSLAIRDRRDLMYSHGWYRCWLRDKHILNIVPRDLRHLYDTNKYKEPK